MCLRLELRMGARELNRQMPGLHFARRDLPPGGEICAESLAPMIAHGLKPCLEPARWGLVGNFLDRPPAQPLLAMPVEGLLSRPFYKHLFLHRRCLVPATAVIMGKTPADEEIRLRPAAGGALMLAAIYDQHPLVGTSFALLTLGPGGHPHAGPRRTPFVIAGAEQAAWLDETLLLDEAALAAWLAFSQALPWQTDYLPPPPRSPQLAFQFA